LLADAGTASGSLDGRFNNAYAAGHHFLTAALKMKGYRPTEGQGGRSVLYQLLDQLVPGAAGSQRLLQRVHELRNREEYDDPMQLTDSLVSDIEVSRKGSVFNAAREQIAGAKRGRTPDYRLSFESARTLFAELTPARLDFLYELITGFENAYYDQLHRYYAFDHSEHHESPTAPLDPSQDSF